MLEIMFWDVDHGSAAYINTSTAKHVAIDLGIGDMSSGEDFSPVKHLHNNYDFDRLDLLVITHPHRDHIDDIENIHLLDPRYIRVNRNVKDEYMYSDNKEEDEGAIEQYKDFISGYSPPSASSSSTKKNAVDWGCKIRTYWPDYDGPNLNNYSLVTIITYEDWKIVIPGDNEGPSWKSLLKQDSFVKAIKDTDVFVASHHGRESGYYADLFKHFKPKLVVISDTNHGDTSVTGSYAQHATGWRVDHGRKGEVEDDKRKCLTTRNDGNILIKCGKRDNGKRYLAVSTELGAPED